MNLIEVNQGTFNATIQNVALWETPAVEQLLKEVSDVLIRRKLLVLPTREGELIQQINLPAFSTEQTKQFESLQNKLESSTITETEHTNLLDLIQKQEAHNVERLRCLIELSQIRKISLDDLMLKMGIQMVSSYA
jgi:uncharacterized protein YjaZ